MLSNGHAKEKGESTMSETLSIEQDKSQADRMVDLALKKDAFLFKDQYKNPYIRYLTGSDDVYVTQSLRTGEVRDWLAGLLWDAEKKAPGGEATNSALAVLRAMANDGPIYPLYNRVAPDGGGGILIDLANPRWDCIQVTPKGWSIIESIIPVFRRYSHMRNLPMPEKNGDLTKIMDFVNLSDEGDRLLYLVSVISNFIPEIQHIILVFWGVHGSGKSLAMRAARSICDPSITDLLTLPRNDRELIQQLFHHHLGYFDNVSGLPDWASDIFCRASTGTGNTKRALFTDDDDIVYSYRRCIGINGINIVAHRGDFMDRSLILECKMIENSHRVEETKLIEKLEAATPTILGGILDVLVKALNIYPTIQLDQLPRMTDFTRWGVAITEALGEKREKFLDAYDKNIKLQNEEVLKSSLIGTVLTKFMDTMNEDTWEGVPTELYYVLEGVAEGIKVNLRQKDWPKNAKWMTRRINEIIPSLTSMGYHVETDLIWIKEPDTKKPQTLLAPKNYTKRVIRLTRTSRH